MILTTTEGYNNWYTAIADIQKKPLQSTFTLNFNHTDIRTVPFQQAADEAAKLFAKNHADIYIGLSGGLDSEFVAEVFYRNNIKFTPIVATVEGSTDYMFALEWCYRKKIAPIFIEFKTNDPRLIPHFINSCKGVKQECNLVSVIDYLCHYVRNKGGTLVAGESPLVRHTARFDEAAGDVYDIYASVFYPTLIDPSLPLCNFLLYTPELMLAMATESDTSTNHSSSKSRLYGVPFRVKELVPTQPMDSGVTQKIFSAVHTELYSPLPPAMWNKNELIGLLLR